jgi:DNA-binding response OmpR family regulator
MSNQSWNKVLIVDDEPTIRWMLAEALRGWGYETVEAGTGAATLAAIVTERPAAVLLDINLPDSSGLDLLREIKRRSPQTAVIMITAQLPSRRRLTRHVTPQLIQPDDGLGITRRAPISARR